MTRSLELIDEDLTFCADERDAARLRGDAEAVQVLNDRITDLLDERCYAIENGEGAQWRNVGRI